MLMLIRLIAICAISAPQMGKVNRVSDQISDRRESS
ncbi:hypothetical protein ZBT109_1190 [Zymobacter palmae]|uniref:Uncharacterized protein n=1 Tax=Zymobacter palmae TaxID=33074 RepID=A0A348HE98_9GAMM|nr:hypothetical protein ZBT109_1190 [Zymobacter palmae]